MLSRPPVIVWAGALALSSLLLTGPTLAKPRAFDVRDLVMLDRVSDPQISPDGTQIAFAVRKTDLDENKGVSGIWRVAAGGGDSQRLSKKDHDAKSPRWSPDGTSIYFIAKVDDSKQIWRYENATGKSRRVTDYKLDVGGFKLGPHGKTIALTMDVFPDCDSLACTKKRLDNNKNEKVSGALHNKLFIRHWDEWKDGRRSQLFTASIDDKGKLDESPVLVSKGIDGDIPSRPFGDSSEYTFSSDGGSLVFAARIAGRTEAWSTNLDLFLVPVDGSSPPENLTADNIALDNHPLFSRDGKTLYYLAMKRPGFEADRVAIMAKTLA